MLKEGVTILTRGKAGAFTIQSHYNALPVFEERLRHGPGTLLSPTGVLSGIPDFHVDILGTRERRGKTQRQIQRESISRDGHRRRTCIYRTLAVPERAGFPDGQRALPSAGVVRKVNGIGCP